MLGFKGQKNCASSLQLSNPPYYWKSNQKSLVFLWPNTAPILQPMDQGVIRGLKAHYQKQYVRKLIRSLDKNAPLPDAWC